MNFTPGGGPNPRHRRRGFYLGVLLIALGIYFLLENLHLLPPITADIVWPVILILLGVWFLIGRRA